jgi:hypothetical protein
MTQPKQPKKYAMLQLPADVHERLKVYCNKHGFILSGFVAGLIRQALANNDRKQWNKD